MKWREKKIREKWSKQETWREERGTYEEKQKKTTKLNQGYEMEREKIYV